MENILTTIVAVAAFTVTWISFAAAFVPAGTPII
jgi:hypothetical protein